MVVSQRLFNTTSDPLGRIVTPEWYELLCRFLCRGISYVFGLPLNAYGAYTITRMNNWSIANYLLFLLTVFDFSFGLWFLIMDITLIILSSDSDANKKLILCMYGGTLNYILTSCIIVILTLISIDRYILIIHYQRYHELLRHKKAVKASILVIGLLISILFSLPSTVIQNDAFRLVYSSSYFTCKLNEGLYEQLTVSLIVFLPFFVINSINIKLYRFYKQSQARINTHRGGTTDTNGTDRALGRQDIKMIKRMVTASALFVLAYLPYTFSCWVSFPGWLNKLAISLVGVNCITDPVVYLWLNINIRQRMIRQLKCTRYFSDS